MFMMAIGILFFSIISAAFSFLIIRKYERFEKAEIMSYLLLLVWGAFLFGMYIARPSTGIQLVSLLR